MVTDLDKPVGPPSGAINTKSGTCTQSNATKPAMQLYRNVGAISGRNTASTVHVPTNDIARRRVKSTHLQHNVITLDDNDDEISTNKNSCKSCLF